MPSSTAKASIYAAVGINLLFINLLWNARYLSCFAAAKAARAAAQDWPFFVDDADTVLHLRKELGQRFAVRAAIIEKLHDMNLAIGATNCRRIGISKERVADVAYA